MNNYYALKHLSDELVNSIIHLKFHFSLSPHKDVWTAYIGDSASPFRLTFSTHPAETALFTEDYRSPKKNNVTTFFSALKGRKIVDVKIADNDRFISIYFDSDHQLLFQLFGSKPNLFLIRDNTILESFKNPDLFSGRTPPLPRPASSPTKIVKEGLSPKKTITLLNPKFPRHLIPLVIDNYNLELKNSSEINNIIDRLSNAMENKPEFRILHNGNLCLVPQKYLPAENINTFENVSSAIRFAYYHTSVERRFSSKVEKIKPAISKKLTALESLIEQLSHAEKGIERSEQYEQLGHILMANAHLDRNENRETITLPNYYDDNREIEIPIKPTLSLAENAERYYDKSSSALRNVEESKRRLKQAQKEIIQVKKLIKSIDSVEKIYELDDWKNENEDKLRSLGILSKQQSEESVPYRKFQIGNYEICLGKNAKSNDRLTNDAHKEDVWMHARGTSGSHLVVRMNNNKEMPPEPILLKAAAVAAYHSKARGSELVPVIIVKRKYISKPKGSPPGSVRIQQERVELVKPQKNIQ